MIRFRVVENPTQGDMVYARCSVVGCPEQSDFDIPFEVLDVRGDRVEVAPLCGSRTCVWVDREKIFTKETNK